MRKHHSYLILLSIVIGLGLAWGANAGFGISPPFVKTKKPIFPGSHFEQRITLLRSDTDDGLMARISFDAPEIADWISIKEGREFDLPPNQLQTPMHVVVDVPEDAAVGSYQGYLNIQIVPKERSVDGGVAIALGARVDINLEITDEPFVDYAIRRVTIPDLETVSFPWDWAWLKDLFYRLKVLVRVENTGNVPVAPTKVQVDVYDLNQKNLLETLEDDDFEPVEPFATSEIAASFPTDLAVGEYWGNIRIYQDNEIIHKDKLIFAVEKYGPETGGWPSGKEPWMVLAGAAMLAGAALMLLIKYHFWRIFPLLYRLLLIPLRFAGGRINRFYNKIKINFWRWMHRKSSQYNRLLEPDKKAGQAKHDDGGHLEKGRGE